MKIILASQSPRRKQLLSSLVKDFEVEPSNFDESLVTETNPTELVKILAQNKAKEISYRHKKALIIAADTLVALGGEIFGKPKTQNEAKQILMRLSGKTHNVFTGLCLIHKKVLINEVVGTKVTFKNLDEMAIDEYIASGAPFDKAGGYGIQDCDFVESIEGSFDNVMGLPTKRLKELLIEYFGGEL